ncbi:MAG TPA: chemotaxis protein CheB [Candidatus Kapabacteria bacterium]
MRPPKIIVIGASAGGVEALATVVANLKMEQEAAAFIILHVSPDRTSLLPEILSRNRPEPVRHAVDNEEIEPGKIYVAPPDHHMTFFDGHIFVTRGPRVNRHRPSIDVSFESAADNFGDGVIGVILSGSMNDGALGLAAIKKAGGTVIVQDPKEALYPSMPQSALAATQTDYVKGVEEIGPLLSHLVTVVNRTRSSANEFSKNTKARMGLSETIAQDLKQEERSSQTAKQSIFTCPDCGGALWERKKGEIVQFACHEGHRMTAESLVEGQSEKLEEALWTAARVMKEKAVLCRKLSETMDEKGNRRSAERFTRHAIDLEQHLVTLRNMLIHDDSLESPSMESNETNVNEIAANSL